MVANSFFKQSHHRAKEIIGDNLKDIEHFRTYDPNPAAVRENVDVETLYPSNTAVLVLNDGRCYVGKSYCSPKDRYNPSRGYEIALGRAMKEAGLCIQSGGYYSDFKVSSALCGRSLRDEVRKQLMFYSMVGKFNSPKGPVD